jgi:WD40 repeat protein
VHSTLSVGAEEESCITALASNGSKLLVGSTSDLSLWQIGSGERVWRRTWACKTPGKPISSLSWSTDGTSFAAALRNDKRVLIWSLEKQQRNVNSTRSAEAPSSALERSSQRVQFVQRLVLPRKVQNVHWRRSPSVLASDLSTASSSASHVLIVSTSNGVQKIYAPVIDQPGQLRLWGSIDAASYGSNEKEEKHDSASRGTGSIKSKVVCLDAGDFSDACNVSIVRMRNELQMLELGVGTSHGEKDDLLARDRKADILRTRIKRLEHFSQDTPDMFMRVREDGNILIWGVAVSR